MKNQQKQEVGNKQIKGKVRFRLKSSPKVGSKRVRKQKHLDDWEWTTLVAAWRYFEYRMTIASASFPEDIIRRYFTGAYDEESCKRIAHQFAITDHGLRGEEDWTDGLYLMDCDKEPWCRFFAFCKAYYEGFKTIVLDGDSEGNHIHEEAKAFYCEYTKHWHNVDAYLSRPFENRYYIDEFVKEVK